MGEWRKTPGLHKLGSVRIYKVKVTLLPSHTLVHGCWGLMLNRTKQMGPTGSLAVVKMRTIYSPARC